MPRINTAYVSEYQRTRQHASRYTRGEKFVLKANLKGILANGETIEQTTWRVQNPCAAILGTGTNNATEVQVICTAGYAGGSMVKCEVTTSEDRVIEQMYWIRVQSSPWFLNDTYPEAGPYTVTVITP